MLKQFGIPDSFETFYSEPNQEPHLYFGENAFVLEFMNIEETYHSIKTFYANLCELISSQLNISIKTKLEFTNKGSKEAFFLPSENKIILDHRNYLFMNSPYLNIFFLVKVIGHELGHAVHHYISEKSDFSISNKKSVFASENIAQYFELVAGKLCSIFLSKDYPLNFEDYQKSLLYDFNKRYKRVISSKESVNIDQLINLPILPLTVPCIINPDFLIKSILNGYRTFDVLLFDIKNYIKKNYMKELDEIYISDKTNLCLY